jgi:DNA-binding ferritin-like protein (Dps family)
MATEPSEQKNRYLKYIELVTGTFEGKRRWRAYKARVKALPASYRAAVEALERYLMFFGGADGDSAASMFEDLADLFEQAAADGTAIREIVGQDPVDFIEAFLQNYTRGSWVVRERERLTSAIERAEAEDGETHS